MALDRPQTDPESLRGSGSVASLRIQNGEEDLVNRLVELLIERNLDASLADRTLLGGRVALERAWEVDEAHGLAWSKEANSLHGVSKLPNIARPAVAQKGRHHRAPKFWRPNSMKAGQFGDELLGQRRDVGGPVA